MFTGSEMVKFPDAELNWKVDNLDWARSDIDMLCVKTGGKARVRHCPVHKTGSGIMDSAGDAHIYKCSGIERGLVRAEFSCPVSSKSTYGQYTF